MSYRVLCDENVAPRTVRYLQKEGHDAVHVGDVLELGVDDPSIAEHARQGDYVLLTNDADFLDDDTYPDLAVLYFPDNRTSAYELAAMVAQVASTVPNQDDLPRTVFLTRERS